MKILALTCLAFAFLATGCVSVERDEPSVTRTTTVSPAPGVGVSSTTTTY